MDDVDDVDDVDVDVCFNFLIICGKIWVSCGHRFINLWIYGLRNDFLKVLVSCGHCFQNSVDLFF